MPDPAPAPERPQLRPDLEFSPAVERGRACTYVRDPFNQNFFRLGDTARRAVERMDGRQDAAAIAGLLSQELEVEVPVEPIRALVSKLSGMGFLTNGAQPRPKQGLRGSAFFLLIPMLDPDRWLDRWQGLWRVLVSTPVIVAIGALILAGAAATVQARWLGLTLGLEALTLLDLVMFYSAVALAVTVHELAHAVTLKRFGGEVHEIGLLLLYFQPCFYCNVSDAYLLPRRQRLWVSFAGIYIELGLWGAATLVALLTDPAEMPGRVARLVAAVVGLKALLLNLNPLIKLDGYYLLVDLLQIPNLRQRAFAYLADRVGVLLGRAPQIRTADRREALTLLSYALLASAFLLLLFSWLLWRLWAVLQHGEWSPSAIFLSVVGGFLLLRGLRYLWRSARGSRVEPSADWS